MRQKDYKRIQTDFFSKNDNRKIKKSNNTYFL